MAHGKGIGYDTDALIERLRERAMTCDAELAFLLGVASGRLRAQENHITKLEAALECANVKLEDKDCGR